VRRGLLLLRAAVKLNDDRLGRPFDALAEHLDEVLGVIARRD
jgi:hypothetical protein